MLECLILGDSIAVGTKMFAPTECVSYSKGGFNSWQWNQRWGMNPVEANTVVISLGTNDHVGVNTEKELKDLVNGLVSKPSQLGGQIEGVVVRNASLFHNDDFADNVMKWVRKGHVTTDEHWTRNWIKAKIN